MCIAWFNMIACLHIRDYPAWVMRYRYPDAALAVFHRGRILARNRKARRKVQVGELVERARSAHPEVQFLGRDTHEEEIRWEYVLEKINRYTPLVESAVPGTAYFQPLEGRVPAPPARELSVRVGAGPSRAVARIAAARTHDGHFLEIAPRGVRTFLRASPVSTLCDLGFPEEMVERLTLFGLDNLERIRQLTRRHLTAQFGADGEALHDLLDLQKTDPPIAVYRPSPAILCFVDFENDVIEPADILPALQHLVSEARDALEGLVTSRITLETTGKSEGANRICSAVLKSGTSDAGILFRAAERRLKKNWPQAAISRIRLILGALGYARHHQGALFFQRPDVQTAVRRVHRRYPNALLRVVPAERRLPLEEADGLSFVPYRSAS